MRGARSVRTYLIGLIIGVLCPLLGFSGFLVLHGAEQEQEVMALLARDRTRIAAAAIDDELSALRGRLFLLAGRLSLETTDLGQFQSAAKNAFGAMTVVLSDASGHEIINTNVPFGTPLPNSPDLNTIHFVAATQQPRIGDLTTDPVSHRPAIMIAVPVTRDSRLVYVLLLDISSTLPRILAELDLPEGWIAAIFDRQGVIIGRSRDPERFVGQLAFPDFLARMRTESEGWFPGRSREGVPLFSAFAHTRLGGWTVNAGMPRSVLLAPVRQTTWSLVLLGGATLVLAMLLAIVIGRRIASPIIGLVPIAEAVGRGVRIVPRPTGLTEANVVARTLFDSGEQLRRAAADREATTAALRQSEQMHRELAGDLALADAERSALLTRVVVAQEHERKRIARELHDSLAQYLTALRLKLDMLGKSNRSDVDVLSDLRSLIADLGRAVNRMAWELRPVALDELGLRSAVTHYVEEWAQMAGLRVDLEIDLGPANLPPAIEATLFRVLQEATTNVIRHANATRVAIILELKEEHVRLIVEDNGKGFPVEDEKTSPAGQRFGLHGMRERLALVHGTLDVESSPSSGATLFVSIPLDRVQPEPEQQMP